MSEGELEYPETLAVAKLIYENLPSEDPGGGVEPWDELTDEQRAPFLMNARNLGHVFPGEYPKLAAELARFLDTATRQASAGAHASVTSKPRVWVALSHCFEDVRVEGVYASRAAAEDAWPAEDESGFSTGYEVVEQVVIDA
ncbi:hypothetical protein SEA_BIRDSONG_42 [Gordonia phage Birdsong]